MDRRTSGPLLAILLAVAIISFAAPARAGSTGGPVALEIQVSDNGPLGGLFGLTLGYDRGGWLAGGVGMGVGDFREHTPPFGLFGRARLLRIGTLALGIELSLAREYREVFSSSGMVVPPYAYTQWEWQPAYRGDAQIFAEILAGAWSFRLAGGLGRRLNDPRCDARGCYQWDVASDRDPRSFSFVLGHRFDFSAPAVERVAPGYRSPATAFRLSLYATMLPILAGATLVATGINYNQEDGSLVILGGASILLGATFGPSAGYFYAGETVRAWGAGLMRLLGVGVFVASTLSYMSSNLCESCDGGSGSNMMLVLGFGGALASVVSGIYDIHKAPQAARRENERRGIAALAFVPILPTGGAESTKGLALAGRF